MNYKHVLAGLVATGLVGGAIAQMNQQQKENLLDPDFLITVPVDLKDMPGELYEAVVWCEVIDQGRNVIAETGGISVAVENRHACNDPRARMQQSKGGSMGCPGEFGYKTPQKWSANKVWGRQSAELAQAAGRRGGSASSSGAPGKGIDMRNLPPDQFILSNNKPGGEWVEVPGVMLRASTPGAVNPASGANYACHMGFKADVLIDSRYQNITVFGLDAGTLKTIPTVKDAKMQREVFGSLQDGKGGENFKK